MKMVIILKNSIQISLQEDDLSGLRILVVKPRTMRAANLLIPDAVSERVTVISVPRYEEQSCVSFVDFIAMKRFGEKVKLNPCLTPIAFRDTIVCFEDSPKKRYKSETHYVPKVRPQKYSDTLIIFPKRPSKSYVTYVDYHIDECRRWFKTTMEFKARTYTTRKMIGNDLNSEGDSSESSDDDDVKNDVNVNNVNVNDGPGASQIFLPRWNRDQSDVNNVQLQHLVNGDIIMNGY